MFGEVSKEALDHVQPRCAGGCKVTVEAFVSRKPCLHFFMLVSCVVVANQMNIPILGNSAFDLVEKFQPFLMSMLLFTTSDQASVQYIERGKKRAGAMSLVVVGHRLPAPLLERQARLSAIQGLHLALLVARKDQGMFGRTEIESNDVLKFFYKLFVIGELECSKPMWLESVSRPYPTHSGGANTRSFGHASPTPMSGVGGLVVECHVDDSLLLAGGDGRNSAGASFIFDDTKHPRLSESTAPPTDFSGILSEQFGNLLVLHTIGRQ